MKVEIVIPHHLKHFDFLEAWKYEFLRENAHIIVVEDKPKHEAILPSWVDGGNFEWYDHSDIDQELGANSWIIPRGTSAIRSFGLYKAWQRKPDMIITLDNDCFPDRKMEGYFIKGHELNLKELVTLDWCESTPSEWLGLPSRGFPYLVRNQSPVAVSHGLWSNIPDLDAPGMLLNPLLRTEPVQPWQSIVIPRNNFYPMCGMNLAFRPEVTPLMYFGLFGEKYGFDQFDDIWAGVFSKKVMDHLGWAVRSGYPSVEHRKQSNAFVNFKKQAGGLEWNEEIWKAAKDVILMADNPTECYRQLINTIELPNDPYFKKMVKATNLWLDLFKKE